MIYADALVKETALPQFAITALLTVMLMIIAIIDLRQFRIPDVLSLPLIVFGIAVAWILPVMPMRDHLIGIAVGFGTLALIGEVYFRHKGTEGLGLGDAKLFGAAGAWLGWQALPAVLLIASLSGILFVLLWGKDRRVAFGPWLALGFWLMWLIKRHFGN